MLFWKYYDINYRGAMRPCKCDKTVIGEKFLLGRDCPLCWFAWNSEAHQELWDFHPKTGIVGCLHRGDPTGEEVDCPGCNGRVRIKIYSCDLHGKCTLSKETPGVKRCSTCHDYRT
jgi:hypothetical protein